MFRFAEDADARHDAAFVAARGQGFQEQAVGFVAAAVGRVVEGILGQEDAHLVYKSKQRLQRRDAENAEEAQRKAPLGGVTTADYFGLISRAGEDYPQEWLNQVAKRGLDIRGIQILPENIDLRSFYAYTA